MMHCARLGLLAVLLLSSVLAVGCGDTPEIRSQRAPKPLPDDGRRTIAAILTHGDTAWFFKVTGLDERVASSQEAFENFLETVRFDDQGRPQWDLPEGWHEERGDAMRYRTLRMSAATVPLELTVTSLPLRTDDVQEYLLSNVNRWRSQLELGPITAEQFESEVEQREINGNTVYLVNFVGTGSGVMAATAPPSARGSGSVPPETSPPGASPSLAYQVPEGWKEQPAQGMRLAAFTIEADGQTAEVTVIPLGLAGGDLLDNVNRWRGQVQLPPIDQAQLEQDQRSLEVEGAAAPYFVLIGPAAEGSDAQGILGVILPRPDRVWFIKMMGNAALVEREQAHFEQFVQSLRLP